MISNYDLILKCYDFIEVEPSDHMKSLVNGIIKSYHDWGQLTRLQHTVLIQFCMSHEWAQEEYARYLKNVKRKDAAKKRGPRL